VHTCRHIADGLRHAATNNGAIGRKARRSVERISSQTRRRSRRHAHRRRKLLGTWPPVRRAQNSTVELNLRQNELLCRLNRVTEASQGRTFLGGAGPARSTNKLELNRV
jgi:hypothetical protein